MSEPVKPIYERLEDLAAIQRELEAIGLTGPLFVATPDHPSDAVLRNLRGGIIPGVRSARDLHDKLEEATKKGAKGLDLSRADIM